MEIFPVVVILGVRQCGKTCLAKSLRPRWKYFDLEKAATYDRVADDVGLFFKDNGDCLIIDEAQVYPRIFNELRGIIDSDRKRKGRFVLSGSSSPELLKRVSESLAGRAAIVELSTLKANEVYERKLSKFYEIINKKADSGVFEEFKLLEKLHTHKEIKNHFLKGGYPDACLAAEQHEYDQWMENYLSTYINRDIRSLFPKLDMVKYRRFMGVLSHLSGKLINKSEIARAVEVDDKTARDYLEIAHGTFVWRNIHSLGRSKSVIKMPKGGYRDSGLLNYQKKIKTEDDLNESPSVGVDFEQFVAEELIKGLQASDMSNWDCFYYRTRGGAEVDLVLDGPYGLVPIEIKYGTRVRSRDLISLSKFIAKNDLPAGVVINNADEVAMIGEKIIQVPVQFI